MKKQERVKVRLGILSQDLYLKKNNGGFFQWVSWKDATRFSSHDSAEKYIRSIDRLFQNYGLFSHKLYDDKKLAELNDRKRETNALKMLVKQEDEETFDDFLIEAVIELNERWVEEGYTELDNDNKEWLKDHLTDFFNVRRDR